MKIHSKYKKETIQPMSWYRQIKGVWYFLILITFSFVGCKKFINIPAPTSQLVTSTTFNNDATATSAILSIYQEMNASSSASLFRLITVPCGELSDELKPAATSGTDFQYFTNAMNNGTSVYGAWQGNSTYFYIYQANTIMAGLQQYTGTSPAVKQQLLGEAYFIRAFLHFYLTNQYGAVPIVLTTDYTVTDKLARSPRVQVLQQVISDLNTATNLLSNNYVDASDATTTDRVRPTKAAATALLARAYLYAGDYNKSSTDYQNAVTAASNVISNNTYSLCSNLSGVNSVFLKNSSEAIWQLATPLPSSYDTPDGALFVLLAAPTSSQYLISAQLLSTFEVGDQRKVNWIGSVTINGTTYNFPYKYKDKTYLGNEYMMMLRLAEQYLIRSEAEAELGQTAAALADLNVIRHRAGLADYAGLTDQASLLGAIQHERQVELFTEWGHRWFDLNRAVNTASTINVNTVLGSPGNVCQAKGGTWSSDGHQTLFPVPLTEIQKDPNISQNPGY